MEPEFSFQESLTVSGEHPAHLALELAPNRWVQTRCCLMEAGQLKDIDLARVTGSGLAFSSLTSGFGGEGTNRMGGRAAVESFGE